MKLVYKPFGLLLGLLAGLLANLLFRKLWAVSSRRDEVPGAKQKSAGWGEVAASAALQGAVMKGTRALVDRAGARGFEKATGTWPGDA
ncbi:MAG: hypothetical protein JWP14_3189 [Frankiales bacterium]|nr:hypothetical protein [Frankiales bacterium]